MIKARKGFVPVLLALMTIFVLVPSMAFAANAASWGAKYATVTDTDGLTFKTVRTFDAGTGLVTATPQDDTSVIGDTKVAPTTPAYFYDLEGSSFVAGANALDGATMTQAAFEAMTPAVKIIEQAYTPTYASTTYNAATAANYPATVAAWSYDSANKTYTGQVALTNWTIVVESSAYESGLEADQTVTLKVKSQTPAAEVVPTVATTPDLDGTVAQATITVKGLAKTPATADFYMDSTDSMYSTNGGTTLNGLYDGAAHTVVCDTVPGWTVSYEVYNATTGKWDAASAVTITDKQATAIQARATFKKTGEADVKKTINVNLIAADTPTISFVEGDINGQAEYNLEGDTYDAWSFVEMIPYEYDIKTVPEAHKAEARAANAANKKATEANEKALMEAFKEYVEITATAGKNTPNNITLTFEEKDLTSAEKSALDTKYEALFQNFGITDITDLLTYADYTTAYVNLNWSADFEVEFTDTPTAMTYKAKKLKKKAASFTVTAVANNGATVKYKLIDAPEKITIDKTSGKITLAKGLKKGTYKIKVKAYVPGYSSYEGAWETQAIKIKVKK